MQKLSLIKKAEENLIENLFIYIDRRKQSYANKNVKSRENLKKMYRIISLKTFVNLSQKRSKYQSRKKLNRETPD